MVIKKKKKHGGKRKGSGRPVGSTTKEPTVVIRVPVSIATLVKEFIKDTLTPASLKHNQEPLQ